MKSLLYSVSFLICTSIVFSVCPTADLTQDCQVDFEDFAVLASQWIAEDMDTDPNLFDLSSQWLEVGVPEPNGMVFVTIPTGTFQMGDNFNEGSMKEQPVHTVSLNKFKMSRHETTNGQYANFLNSIASQIKVVNGVVYALSDISNSQKYCRTYSASQYSQIDYSSGHFAVRSKSFRDMSNDPVVEVSWYGAKVFCDFYGYRLPTEAEWEFAARGGLSSKRFPWGDSINHEYANFEANGSFYSYDTSPYSSFTYHVSYNDGVKPYTSPVGIFAANGYGLCDMAGNVWEWCYDVYDYDYYEISPQHDPRGPVKGTSHIGRGGSWASFADRCRVACRFGGVTGIGGGFRCVKDFLKPVPDVIDMVLLEAEVTITDTRFVVGQVTQQYSDETPLGYVISQNPPAGAMHLTGTDIDIITSKGQEPLDNTWIDIPAGTFQMGDSSGGSDALENEDENESPVHTVTLSPFKMSKYLITNQQYCDYLNSVNSSNQLKVDDGVVFATDDTNNSFPFCTLRSAPSGRPEYGNYSHIDFSGGVFLVLFKGDRSMVNDPVILVSWYGAKAFCDYNGCRLPTEAEWEYAARGGLSGKRFPWGDTITHSQANYQSSSTWFYDVSQTRGRHPIWNDGISPCTSPVGSFPENGYGLCDMAGNVWEWCNDNYSSSFYSISTSIDPTGPEPIPVGSRVLRGGSYSFFGDSCRVANRGSNSPYNRNCRFGFRVCID